MIDLNSILEDVKNGKLHSVYKLENITHINEWVTMVLNLSDWNTEILQSVKMILTISNILYNNTSRNTLLLDDGVYDLLLEKYRMYNKDEFEVGAIPVRFDEDLLVHPKGGSNEVQVPWRIIEKAPDMFFYNDFIRNDHEYDFRYDSIPPWSIRLNDNTANRNVPHLDLELTGTLDKCKFVLNKDAIDKGVFDDPKVKVFERDFIGSHLRMGLIDLETQLTMIMELKYDGISIVGKVKNGVLVSACTRGDTANDKSADLTPFLGGYIFPRATEIDEEINIQFEAIITNLSMNKLQNMGLNYINGRNAIIGIAGRLDAAKFRDYVTLVPLKTDIMDSDNPKWHLDRLVEIEFLNKYFAREVNLKYSIIQGDYVSILYQVNKYMQEAEYMRQFIPFMYDGIVVSYYGEEIRQELGRKNFINKYSMAIKFNPMAVDTVFLGYKYTIGMNGVITPMIYYRPVEFYGAVHDHSSGHSYARFKELALKPGDIIRVTYTNDVMPYVDKLDIEANNSNPNHPVEFITNCPVCGCEISISQSQKQAICPNPNCHGRKVALMTNMVSKLGFVGFSTEYITDIIENTGIESLSDLLRLTAEDVRFLGPNLSVAFYDKIREFLTKPIYDYNLMGAMGFTNIAAAKWKIILNKVSLVDIVYENGETLLPKLTGVKSIGKATAITIIQERMYHFKDLELILGMKNLIPTLNMTGGKKIRFTGIRDSELCKRLNDMGHDAGEGTVTKDTDILVVPAEGHVSKKSQTAAKYGIPIIAYKDFVNNLDSYLS